MGGDILNLNWNYFELKPSSKFECKSEQKKWPVDSEGKFLFWTVDDDYFFERDFKSTTNSQIVEGKSEQKKWPVDSFGVYLKNNVRAWCGSIIY